MAKNQLNRLCKLLKDTPSYKNRVTELREPVQQTLQLLPVEMTSEIVIQYATRFLLYFSLPADGITLKYMAPENTLPILNRSDIVIQ